MRVTPGMLTEITLRNLQTASRQMLRVQDQLTSGHRITRPSDDPAGTARVLHHQAHLDRIGQYQTSINDGTAWLNATEQALDAVGKLLGRARELAVQGANAALSASDLQAASQEAGQLLHQAVATGNSMMGDRYLFAGHQTATVPFTAGGATPASVTYHGDDGEVRRQVDDHSIQAVNISGNGPFPEVFATLIDLRDRLGAGDHAGVSALITNLEQAADGVIAARALTAGRLNRLESTADHLETLKISVSAALSTVKDLDFSEALVRYATGQNLYKAALEVGGRAVQPSLLDYLR